MLPCKQSGEAMPRVSQYQRETIQMRLNSLKLHRKVTPAGVHQIEVPLVFSTYYFGRSELQEHEVRVMFGGNFHIRTFKFLRIHEDGLSFEFAAPDGFSEYSGNVLVAVTHNEKWEPDCVWITPLSIEPIQNLYPQLVSRIVNNDPQAIAVSRRYGLTTNFSAEIDNITLPDIFVYLDAATTRRIAIALGSERKGDDEQALLTLKRQRGKPNARMLLQTDCGDACVQLRSTSLAVFEADNIGSDTVVIYQKLKDRFDADGADNITVYSPSVVQTPTNVEMDVVVEDAFLWGPLLKLLRKRSGSPLTLFLQRVPDTNSCDRIIVAENEDKLCFRVLTTSVKSQCC